VKTLVPTIAVAYDGRDYLVADLVLEGIRSGAWLDFERSVIAGLAREREAGDVDPDELKSAAVVFRRARRLVSGEDLQRWREARNLTSDQWTGCLRRSLLRSEASTVLVPEAEVEAVLRAEAICSGLLRRLGETVVEHAAAARGLGDQAPPVSDEDRSLAASLSVTALADEKLGLDLIPPPAVEERLAHLIALAGAATALAEAVDDPVALEALVADNRLEWARVAWAELRFASEGAAKEGALLIREDGLSPAGVAQALGLPLAEQDAALAEVEPGLAPLLVGSAAGDLVGPLADGDDWRLLAVTGRAAPTLDDLETRRRAHELVYATALERNLTGRVRWHGEF
jgi:hypothetical protein